MYIKTAYTQKDYFSQKNDIPFDKNLMNVFIEVGLFNLIYI